MTNIEWTHAPGFIGATWNPVIGCRHVAEGCRHCYAETMSKRLAAMGQKDYASILDAKGKFNGKAIARPETLAEPLHWKKPRMVFVNSMSDLFHEDVPFEFIAAVFGVMAACPQHTFQVLTKRPERALQFLQWADVNIGEPDYYLPFTGNAGLPEGRINEIDASWPLPNVWLGVSIATQANADENIPILLKCPAAVRFVSAEPLIGAVYFQGNWLRADVCKAIHAPSLDWIIVGCESGSDPREHHLYESRARSVITQCRQAGIACFHKQMPIRRPSNVGYRVSHDPAEWQEDLRVQEFPKTEVRA